jgi:hypothetical protein
MNYTASLAASHKHFKGHDAAGDMSLVAAGQDTTGIYTGEDLLRSIVTVIKPTMHLRALFGTTQQATRRSVEDEVLIR